MQHLFPNATQYKTTSSRFLPLATAIKVKDFVVTQKMITTYNSRFERSHINLKTHRDVILRNSTKDAIKELAEKFPSYSCYVLLGDCEIPHNADKHSILDAFRFNVSRNDTTRKIFVTITLQARTSPAAHKEMLLEMIPLMSGVAVSIPEEEEEELLEEDA